MGSVWLRISGTIETAGAFLQSLAGPSDDAVRFLGHLVVVLLFSGFLSHTPDEIDRRV